MKWTKNLTKVGSPAWLIVGAGLLLSCLGWTLLSTQFRYGQGHTQRPIIEFLILYLTAWTVFLFGFVLLKKAKGNGPLVLIIAVSLAARLILLPSSLIQENDVYRYVLDGQVLRHGVNPYHYSPLVVSDLAQEPLRTELERPEAKEVLSRVGYPEIPTVYPPAAQVVFAFGAWLGEWNWMGQRWTLLAVDLAVLVSLLHLLYLLEIPMSWVLLYAWNPLVLKEVINSVHLDVCVALFVLLALIGLLRYERSGGFQWPVFSGIAVGVAILFKFYPLLLVAACFFFLQRRSGRILSAGTFLAVVAGTIAVGFLPFLSATFDQLSAGLSTYATRWTMNEGAFVVLSGLFPHPRLASALLIATIAMLVPWSRKSQKVSCLVGDFQWVLLFWFLLIPAPFPWYAMALVALLPLRPLFSAVSAATVVLSGSVGLYYLGFFYEYHDYPSLWWMTTQGIEHGIIWISLGVFLVHQLGLKTGAPGFQAGSNLDFLATERRK
ncbi:MAG: hypothetical protein ACE5MK_12490 [Acidobacteriota bacterium]